MSFRCAAASLGRDEPMLGTASTVRAFLLVENAGPWGIDALRDARLPDHVKQGLRDRCAAAGVRPLLVRRHRGPGPSERTRVFAAYADPSAPWLETTTVENVDGLLEVDVEALGRGESPGLTPVDEPLFCVCTHGRHDACCAERGRPTASALSGTHPGSTWEVSHIGGDRFAANVLVLPDGLYYGRVSADSAVSLADRHLSGHLDLDRLRGRSGLSFPVQVAEVAVRRETGETATRAVRVVSVRRDGADTAVRLDVSGSTYDVTVRRSAEGRPVQLTCQARRNDVAPAYDVVALTRAGDGAPSTGPATPPGPRG